MLTLLYLQPPAQHSIIISAETRLRSHHREAKSPRLPLPKEAPEPSFAEVIPIGQHGVRDAGSQDNLTAWKW